MTPTPEQVEAADKFIEEWLSPSQRRAGVYSALASLLSEREGGGVSELRTVTLAELLEAAGWTRAGVTETPIADLWTDPLDPKGRRWFGRAAILEELRRREPKKDAAPRPPIPSTAPVAEPPPSQSTREPVDGDLLF